MHSYPIEKRLCSTIGLTTVLGLLLVLAGCQTAPTYSIGSDSDPYLTSKAHLPKYEPGEYYVFDDGTSELVTEISEGLVTWRNRSGGTRRAYPNFIIPDLSWTSTTRSSQGRASVSADFLWPLTVGRKGRFRFEQTLSPTDGSAPETLTRNWTCEVEGTAHVTVPAGSFDTVVVSCTRYSGNSGSWRGKRRFFYSPELGHYVIREDRYRSHPYRKRELVAYGFNSTVLSEPDQIKLNQTLQSALARNKDGQVSIWKNRSGDITAMLVPVRSYTGPDGRKCREYRSIYSFDGRIRQNVRDVCRRPDGQWQRVNQ